MKITPLNIDDIIRAKKRENIGKEVSFCWGKDGFLALSDVVMANAPCIHGWFCLCGEITDEWKLDRNSGSTGFRFMGSNHYWNFEKRGYSIVVNPL